MKELCILLYILQRPYQKIIRFFKNFEHKVVLNGSKRDGYLILRKIFFTR